MRTLLALLLLLASPALAAAPCAPPVTFYDGFAGQFFATPTTTPKTSGFIYGLDEQTLYVTFYNGAITGFSNVPVNTAQAFNYSLTPDTFYTTQIKVYYTKTYTCGSPPLG